MEIRNLKKCELVFRDDKILELNFGKDSEIEKEDVKDIAFVVKELTKGTAHANYADISNLKYMSSGARSRFAEEKDEFLKAVAILTKTSVQKVFSNIYLKFYKPKTQTRLFTDKEEAIQWLKEQMRLS